MGAGGVLIKQFGLLGAGTDVRFFPGLIPDVVTLQMLEMVCLFDNVPYFLFGGGPMVFFLETAEQKIVLPKNIHAFPLTDFQCIHGGIHSGMSGFDQIQAQLFHFLHSLVHHGWLHFHSGIAAEVKGGENEFGLPVTAVLVANGLEFVSFLHNGTSLLKQSDQQNA